MLFIKGFIVGIGKIIPGVSGAMLAINFKVYERLLDSITNFWNNPKENIKFLIIFCSGLLLSIVLCSNIMLYLFNNYKFITMMFFIGLIIGGTYNFSQTIKFSRYSIISMLFITVIVLFISLNSFNNSYIFKNSFIDNIIFFIGGIIEIFASIVPGISATSLFMMIGIYNHILKMISSIFNFNYVIKNIDIYLSYGIGMFLSFIIGVHLIDYLLKKYHNQSYHIILSLSIASIIFLLVMTFKIKITIIEFIIGIMLLVLGLLLSCILDK